MILYLALHGALAAVLAVAVACVRGRQATVREVGLECLTVLLLPGAGALAVALQVLLEGLFSLTVRPMRAGDLVEADEDVDPVALDPAEELRIGASVVPLAEILACEEMPLADLALQRLARADSPSALARLKNALASGDRQIRVRARGLIVRLEDGLVRLIRTTSEPTQRGWAFRRLAMLALDPATAARHLEGAVQAYREALSHQPGSSAGLELGRVLLQLGRPEEARAAFTDHVQRSAEDARGYLGRAEAHLAMRDLRGVRMDLAISAGLDPSLTKVAARWLA